MQNLQHNKLQSAARELTAELGRAPTEAELCARAGLTAERASAVERALLPATSLDAAPTVTRVYSSTGGGGGNRSMQLLDAVAASGGSSDNGGDGSGSSGDGNVAETKADWAMLREELEAAMAAALSPRERQLVRMRAGLDDGVAKTSVALAPRFAEKAHRLRKEEREALAKLASGAHGDRLRGYLELADAAA